MSSSLRISADIGGTFTDLALITQTGVLVTRKVPSTPDNYADAVIKGIEDMLINLNSDNLKGPIQIHSAAME